jgi:hypothetical protein
MDTTSQAIVTQLGATFDLTLKGCGAMLMQWSLAATPALVEDCGTRYAPLPHTHVLDTSADEIHTLKAVTAGTCELVATLRDASGNVQETHTYHVTVQA